jgi:hypothetical protein
MASRYWIKLYHEILDDPKMGRLSDTLFRRTIELFLIAGDYDREGELPPLADISWRLRVPEVTLNSEMEELSSVGILTPADSGNWIVTHFKERQSADPTALRSRHYRQFMQKHKFRHETATDRDADIDVDIDIDTEEEKEEDADKDHNGGSCIPSDELVKTFIEHTSIPLNTGGEEKWAKALARMKEVGVEKADIVSALGECYQKGIVIANLASIVNPAIISMARRKGMAKPEDDLKRYAGGEYGYLLKY